ncbi:ABC transporter permease [Roseibium sp. FZY0029]|uniref:ABC transporter permease n=1 Tax=Roseibium sp. FZY0029 TaxID=3116647 RepID=UPI002EACC47D|nr:ABC transporter permease [Roseibium sp. FZY0029]
MRGFLSMIASFRHILLLTVKELRAIRGDKLMLALIVYVFTIATYMVSYAVSTDIKDLSTAVVDEDHSMLSRRLADVVQPPLFAAPVQLDPKEAEAALKRGDHVLILSIPPNFERDLRAGRKATLELDIDATAVAHAGNGATFMTSLLSEEIARYFDLPGRGTGLVDVVFRNRYNPNLTPEWFTSVMQLMNSITILTLILSGASMIREREHGTIEHVLVMPVRPHEIVVSKILATALVILAATVLSLIFVVEFLIGVPVAGSLGLFVAGSAIYIAAIASIGLLLASFTRSMGQFGLLVIPVIIVMILLSGGMTPLESMPGWLQAVILTVSPSPHFVRFTQSVLYRGSGFGLVGGEMLAMSAMSAAALVIVLLRFRKILSA